MTNDTVAKATPKKRDFTQSQLKVLHTIDNEGDMLRSSVNPRTAKSLTDRGMIEENVIDGKVYYTLTDLADDMLSPAETNDTSADTPEKPENGAQLEESENMTEQTEPSVETAEDVTGDFDPTVTVEPAAQTVETDGRALTMLESTGLTTLIPSITDSMTIEEKRDTIREINRGATLASEMLSFGRGEALYMTKQNEFWRDWTYENEDGEQTPYANLNDYLERELQIHHRKASYLISIYQKFVVELDLTPQQLQELGGEWSKLKEVVSVVTKENADEWINIVKTLPLREVTERVKLAKTGSGSTTSNPEKTTFRYQLPADDGTICTAAIDHAMQVGQTENPSEAFALICMAYMSSSVDPGDVEAQKVSLDVMINSFEKLHGVTLEPVAFDDARYSDPESSDE